MYNCVKVFYHGRIKAVFANETDAASYICAMCLAYEKTESAFQCVPSFIEGIGF